MKLANSSQLKFKTPTIFWAIFKLVLLLCALFFFIFFSFRSKNEISVATVLLSLSPMIVLSILFLFPRRLSSLLYFLGFTSLAGGERNHIREVAFLSAIVVFWLGGSLSFVLFALQNKSLFLLCCYSFPFAPAIFALLLTVSWDLNEKSKFLFPFFEEILFLLSSLFSCLLFWNGDLELCIFVFSFGLFISSLVRVLLIHFSAKKPFIIKARTTKKQILSFFLFASSFTLLCGAFSIWFLCMGSMVGMASFIPTIFGFFTASLLVACLHCFFGLAKMIHPNNDCLGNEQLEIETSMKPSLLAPFFLSFFFSLGDEGVFFLSGSNEFPSLFFAECCLAVAFLFVKYLERFLYLKNKDNKLPALIFFLGPLFSSLSFSISFYFLGVLSASAITLSIEFCVFLLEFCFLFKSDRSIFAQIWKTDFPIFVSFFLSLAFGFFLRYYIGVSDWISYLIKLILISLFDSLLYFFLELNPATLSKILTWFSPKTSLSSLSKPSVLEGKNRKRLFYVFTNFLIFSIVLLSNEDFLLIGTGENRWLKLVGYIILGIIGIFLFFLWRKGCFQISKKISLVSGTLIFLIILSALANKDLSGEKSFHYLYELFDLVFCTFWCSYIGIDEFAKNFIYFVVVACLFSLIMLGIYVFIPSFFAVLPSIRRLDGYTMKMFFFVFMKPGSSRVYGFAHEPGLFAIYLSIALYFVLFRFRNRKKLFRWIAAIIVMGTGLATLSTTALFGLGLIVFAWLFSKPNDRTEKWTKLLLICFSFLAVVIVFAIKPSLLYTGEITGKLFSSNSSKNSRIYGALLTLEPALTNPFFGIGWTNAFNFLQTYGNEWSAGDLSTTNTFTILMMGHGLLYGFAGLLAFFHLAKRENDSEPFVIFLLFISFIIIFSCEDMTTSLLLYILFGYSLPETKCFAFLESFLIPKIKKSVTRLRFKELEKYDDD